MKSGHRVGTIAMRQSAGLLAVAALAACLAVSPSAAMPFFDHHGFSFLTGEPLTVGTVVTVPTVLNEIQPDPIWPLDPGSYEYTILVEGLVIAGVEAAGPIRNVSYSGGTIRLYRDAARNADWMPNPPNNHVPATFEDGEAWLTGQFTEMTMVWNTATGTGVISGTFNWTGGSLLPEIGQPTGWTYFGGVSDHDGLGIPAGFDLAWDPQIYGPQPPNPVKPTSWGQIKSLFNR